MKEGKKKLKEGSLDIKLACFLFKYRITPQCSTGVSPAELMNGHLLRSQLDNIHPDLSGKVRQSQERQALGQKVLPKFRDLQLVYAKNYGQGTAWLPGKVVEKHGSTLYTVLLQDRRQVRKHTDHLMASTESRETQACR